MRQTTALLLVLMACAPTPDRSETPPGTPKDQPSDAEHVVERQYEAYNRRDIEAFVAAHSPNVRFYRYPDSLLFEGRDAIRERFGKMFASSPRLHATVDARLTHGNKIVWRETATGMPGGKTNAAIFVWEVDDSLITKVMVIP
jgi:hypothetical protein